MIPNKIENISRLIDVLRPCIVTYTSNSVYIKSDFGNYYMTSSGTILKPKELSYIKQFRDYFEKNQSIKYVTKYAKIRPQFFKFYKDKGTYKDILEIDINRAYPSAGRILKIIPEHLFEKGLEHSKLAMLVSIGSLYRKRKVIKVFEDGRRQLLKLETPNKHFENLWRSIVGYTDYAMQTAVKSKPDSVYFYWCDAIFVKRDDAPHFIDQLKNFGFECKIKDINKITYSSEKAFVYYKGEKIPKEFARPQKAFTADSIETIRKSYEQKKK